MDGIIRRPRTELTTEAYVEFAPYVRRQLTKLGVRPADIPDLCHEVFMVLHEKAATLDEQVRVDLWLHEVCRRVAAGYRRRAYQKREVLAPEPDAVGGEVFFTDDVHCLDEIELLRDALLRLDDESRDLLALHDGGEMSLVDLAKLVEHDRKTVRKRLDLARARLTTLIQRGEVSGRRAAPSASVVDADECPSSGIETVVRVPAADALPRELEVITVTPNLAIGLLGNVVISVWPGAADLASIETLHTVGRMLIERCGGQIGYLAIVESTVLPPSRPTRKRIVQALDDMGPHVLGYASVMLGGLSWTVRPIMSGMMLLARPRFPMQFFGSVFSASSWLCALDVRGADGPIAPADLCSAGERLRSVRP